MPKGDNLIPSLQTLSRAGYITKKEQLRYQDLEQATTLDSSGNLQLILEVLNKKQKQDKYKVKWPQDLVIVCSMCTRLSYERLNTY